MGHFVTKYANFAYWLKQMWQNCRLKDKRRSITFA